MVKYAPKKRKLERIDFQQHQETKIRKLPTKASRSNLTIKSKKVQEERFEVSDVWEDFNKTEIVPLETSTWKLLEEVDRLLENSPGWEAVDWNQFKKRLLGPGRGKKTFAFTNIVPGAYR